MRREVERLANSCAVCDQDDGLGSGLASMLDGGARLWTLALAAAAVCCLRPARACTVYDMYSTGLASSLCHMVPAVGLFGDNGTFFVNNHYFPCAPPPAAARSSTRGPHPATPSTTCPGRSAGRSPASGASAAAPRCAPTPASAASSRRRAFARRTAASAAALKSACTTV